MSKRYHVSKNGDHWQGKAEGAQRSSVTGSTKAEVLQKTISIAKNQNQSQIIVHKENSRFQEERTYPRSADPHRTKG